MQKEINNWIISDAATPDCLDRLGDARRLADSMCGAVGVLLVSPDIDSDAEKTSTAKLIRFGADVVVLARAAFGCQSERNEPSLATSETIEPNHNSAKLSTSSATNSDSVPTTSYRPFSTMAKVDATIRVLAEYPVTTVFAGGDPSSREWASLLAAKLKWSLISPAMMVEHRRGRRIVTLLNHSGRKSCQVAMEGDEPCIVTMRSGVAEACPPDDQRTGEFRSIRLGSDSDRIDSRIVPANPATCDIRDTSRLVSGGKGLGSAEGFQLLREVAETLYAGVSASRMAVDLGWIEYERQVGQTGKTVQPDVYIACGISGASHHLEGISDSQHIIAINTDADAPIMKKADLALVADLYPVLKEIRRRLELKTPLENQEAQS